MRRVLIYGLSANPPTGFEGHLGIIRHFQQRKSFDEIWILPVYRHMYREKSNLATLQHRVEMCQLAVAAIPQISGMQVRVLETERQVYEKMNGDTEAAAESIRDVGTIDVIHHLREQHPLTRFSLLLGTDAFADLVAGKWKNGEEILQSTGTIDIIVVQRPNSRHMLDQAVSNGSIEFISVPGLQAISSTMARSCRDFQELCKYVDRAVAEYIVKNSLYGFASD
uniref:Uncharacterized protein AlNc14C400G11364 n=1 Tax=Albugo laibachii Nc14 TaxID=890382 RepID=F0WYV4_9STRA|nr:conserved hypothetical protein [Albugo laibachii Nc14]|eukprot:CCA26663.1 conserved hypothetical protein [Albugo laibachii Nc14]